MPFLNIRADYQRHVATAAPAGGHAAAADPGLMDDIQAFFAMPAPPALAPPAPPPAVEIPRIPTAGPLPHFHRNHGPPGRRAMTPGFHLLESRSSDMKPSLAQSAVKYATSRTPESYDALHDEILHAWRVVTASSPSKSTDHAFLTWMIATLERDWPHHAVLPRVPNAYLLPMVWNLRNASHMACLDEAAYPGYTRNRSVVLNRLRLIPNEPPPSGSTVSAALRLDSENIVRLSAGIRRYGAAECLAFAVCAAGIILAGQFRGVLTIETNGVHKFVRLVPSAAGEETIIDLWLGSVGQGIFHAPNHYEFQPTTEIKFKEVR